MDRCYLKGENLVEKTLRKFEDGRVEIPTRAFWQTSQFKFYIVTVLYSNTKSHQNVETSKCYKINENERIIQGKYGSLMPLVTPVNKIRVGKGKAKLSKKISVQCCQPSSVAEF